MDGSSSPCRTVQNSWETLGRLHTTSNLHNSLHPLHCTLNTAHCTEHCTLHTHITNCTLHTAKIEHCQMHTTPCTLHTVHCTLHSMLNHFPQCSTHCTGSWAVLHFTLLFKLSFCMQCNATGALYRDYCKTCDTWQSKYSFVILCNKVPQFIGLVKKFLQIQK